MSEFLKSQEEEEEVTTTVEEESPVDLCSWDKYLQFCEQTYESSEEVTSFKLIQEDMFDLETDQCVLWSFCRKMYTRDCSGSEKFEQSRVVNDSPCCVTEDCTNDYKILRAYAELRNVIAPSHGAVYTPDLVPRRGLLVAGESCSRVRSGELLFEGEYCQPVGEGGKLVAFKCLDGRCTPAYLQLALKSDRKTNIANCELGSYCEYVNRIAITADLNVRHEEWAYRLCDKARRDSLAERSHSSGESPDLSLRSVQSNKQLLYEQIADICETITSDTRSFDRSIELEPAETTMDKSKVIQTVMIPRSSGRTYEYHRFPIELFEVNKGGAGYSVQVKKHESLELSPSPPEMSTLNRIQIKYVVFSLFLGYAMDSL
jgi:hypothetical protein